MANDRIVVTTVAFIVPERYVKDAVNADTLLNVELLINRGSYLQPITLNKCYGAIQCLVDLKTMELVMSSPEYDVTRSVNKLVNMVRELYIKNPDFYLEHIEPDAVDNRVDNS